MPRQVLDGIDYYIIECVYKYGQISYFYVDPSTFLIARKRDDRAYHPDVDSTKVRIETRFSNFTNVQGVVAAHRDDDFDLGKNTLVATHIVTRRILNPQIEAAGLARSVKSPAKLV